MKHVLENVELGMISDLFNGSETTIVEKRWNEMMRLINVKSRISLDNFPCFKYNFYNVCMIGIFLCIGNIVLYFLVFVYSDI